MNSQVSMYLAEARRTELRSTAARCRPVARISTRIGKKEDAMTTDGLDTILIETHNYTNHPFCTPARFRAGEFIHSLEQFLRRMLIAHDPAMSHSLLHVPANGLCA